MHFYGTQSVNRARPSDNWWRRIQLILHILMEHHLSSMISPCSVNGHRPLKKHLKRWASVHKLLMRVKHSRPLLSMKWLNKQGLSLDVVSGGELFTAYAADFPRDRIHFHGNNKSYTELQYAFDEKIGCIVIDNFSEIELVKEIAESRKETMNVLIRVTPGVEAHTHDYITTGQEDSKFGFDLKNGQTDEAFLTVA